MVRRTNATLNTIDGVTYYEFSGLSTDTKPVGSHISTGSYFTEIDTGFVYAYNEEGNTGEEWVKICELGGGS